MKRSTIYRRAVVSIVALTLVATACGSDTTKSPASTSAESASTSAPVASPATATAATTTGASAPAGTTGTSAAALTCSGTPATGTPVEFGSIITLTGASNFRDAKAGIDGAVGCINASGGIAGRPIHVDVCDDQASPTTADACATGFANKIAVIGSLGNGMTQATLDILKAEGVPFIGQVPLHPEDGTDPNSFPLFGGTFALFGGIADQILVDKNKNVAVLVVALPVGDQAGKLLCSILKEGDPDINCRVVPVEPTAADLGPNLVAATTGFTPDAFVLALPSAQCPAALLGIKQAGLKTPAYMTGNCLDPKILAPAGDAISLGRFAAEAKSPLVAEHASDPDVALFTEAVNKFATDPNQTILAQQTFAATYFVKAAGEAIGVDKLTPETLVTYMNTAKDVPILGGVGSYTAGAYSGSKLTPRMGNGKLEIVDVVDGKFSVLRTDIDGLARAAG